MLNATNKFTYLVLLKPCASYKHTTTTKMKNYIDTQFNNICQHTLWIHHHVWLTEQYYHHHWMYEEYNNMS